MFKKIVLAADGTVVMSERLLPVVTEVLENNSGAKLIVAHVQENFSLAGVPLFADDHRALDAALERVATDLKDQGFDAELALIESRSNHAGQALADLARKVGADLIIAGTHGQGPVAGFFQGGFTIHLLKEAPCPVLVIPRQLDAVS
jgi:nucleotide-binding universal stress UspA family protein